MHRFRKKSDAKRGEAPGSLLDTHDSLPELPPTNDFRTSLILPDLSRRFSLLRSPTGEPVSLDHLKSKLANQRARGAETLLTEEEEDMLLETLGRLRSKALQTPERSQEDVVEGEESTKGSARSSGTSSVTSSPSARSTKRYSNNLFGSGRLRDYTYLKNVASSKGSSSTRTVSLTPTEASTKNSTASLRPVTPDSTRPPSVQSSPNEQASIASAAAPYGDSQMQAITAAEYSLQESLGSSGLKRASTALETVIKELEDEAEDEILVPRSVPVTRGSLDCPGPEARNSNVSSASLVFEGGMAISIDQTIHDEFSDRRASPVPARTIPGYVPGMPRPMTPRDLDFDEVRSHSTTPRAQSPFTNLPASPTLPNISTIKSRRESTSSTAKPSPTTPVAVAPLFLQRSTNGRFTPDDGHRSGDALELENPLNSSLLGRRRPASPLSGPAFQPLAVSSRPSSRPGTPSNVIWAPNPNNGRARSHSRSGSWTDSATSDFPGGQGKAGPWPRRSSALLDSPTLEGGQGAQQAFASAVAVNPPKDQSGSSDKPHAYIPEVELGSPLLASFHAPRSPTPTQNARRSPVSPVFPNFDLRNGGSRRTSRQNTASPFPAGAFSTLSSQPLANSSRSSLDSTGSSFHSWDEPDKVLSLFNDSKEQQPIAWHDFDTGKSNSVTPSGGSGDDEEWDAEEIIMRYAGLRKADIAAIQEKLVTAAFTKIANTDPRDRAPSSLRRRRPSTSQSNYTRMASPPPQAQPPASPSPYTADDHYSSKASALLNSVVESIKVQPLSINTNSSGPAPIEDQPLTPNTRRNRDLAHVLFGSEEGSKEDSSDCTTTTTTIKQDTIQPKSEPESVSTSNVNPSLPSSLPAPARQPPSEEQKLSSSVTSPYLLARNPSTNRIPQTLHQQAELAREVQQKTEAATLALKKTPSKTNLDEGLKHTASISRKRIDTSQISTPRLVSASTSVDTIPLRSPSLSTGSGNGPSKLGSRFKKLRGSLRVKNVTSSGEETATPENTRTPPVSQVASYDPAKLSASGAPALSSATEAGRFKVPVPTPPSSAGPGLKGFMARFRNKQRMSEITNERAATATPPTWPASPLTPRPAESRPSISSTTDRPVTPRTGQRPMYSRFPPANLSPIVPPAPQAPVAPASGSTTDLGASQSATALEQLFAAANNLGLDQNALNDLLARSGSTSRALLSRTTSTTATITKASGSGNVIAAQQIISSISSASSDKTATPTSYNGPSAAAQSVKEYAEDGKAVAVPEESMSRKPTVRKGDHLRKPKEEQTDPATAAIVRRTIIYANDSGLPANEFAATVQRKNSSRRRRVSAQSVSARSVHDRVPTPPPSRSPAVKRFSSDTMPPMPQLPNALSQGDNTLKAPSASAESHVEKSNSTYDSLFDMYGGESRTASMAIFDPNIPADQQKGDHTTTPDSGPALEVIELANGETIWNIVNGLRDTDDESIYTGRTSFGSEYSIREPGNDNIQLFVKEHTRAGSKGSTSSFVSRKKPQQGKARPETKVFYSSSAQISRLIESLSQGMDAGSFNFQPNIPNRPGHSASSSMSTNDGSLTVEERLDRMLGAMNRT